MNTLNLQGFLAQVGKAINLHLLEPWMASLDVPHYWQLVKYTLFGWPAKETFTPDSVKSYLLRVRGIYNIGACQKIYSQLISIPLNLLALGYSLALALCFNRLIQAGDYKDNLSLCVDILLVVYWAFIAFVEISTYVMLLLAENERFDDDFPSHGPFNPEF